MEQNLGRFEKVDLREYWKDEARDFTPWLAQEDNLELLGETIGLQIELESTGFSLNLTLNTNSKKMCCEIYVNGRNAKMAFSLLEKEKENIENSMQTGLSWQNDLPRGSACRIAMYRDGDIKERDNWTEYFRWFKEYAESFHKAFSDRIQSLSL